MPSLSHRTVVTSGPYPTRAMGMGALLSVLLLAGCSDMATDIGIKSNTPATIQAEVDRVDLVTKTGRAAAVLHVHMRKSYANACKFGMTLTNNLPFKITNLTFRMTAIIDGNVPFDTQNKNFYGIRPGEKQYREVTFQQVRCDEIDRIEVTDPGRCALGELNRFTAEAGDCLKFSDVASSPLVSVVKKTR